MLDFKEEKDETKIMGEEGWWGSISREKGEQNFLSNPSERKWRGLCEKFGLKSLNSPSGAITIIPLVLTRLNYR
jgi:hypothetical protein